jgi:hypothetical protein
MDIGFVTVLALFFLTAPHIPDTVLYKMDHPVIRGFLILLVFGSLYVGPLESIMTLLAVGALFLERNIRKYRRSIESGASEVPFSFIESTMSPDKRVATTGARISTHAYVEDPSCELESPIAQESSAVGEKPLHETVEGDAQGMATLEKIADMFA